jgi:hypothetical protein
MVEEGKNTIPTLESTPLKFWAGKAEHEVNVVVQPNSDQNKNDALFTTVKEIVGVKDTELAMNLLNTGAEAIKPLVNSNDRLNIVAQTLHDFKPQNAIEARLALQAHALFTHGMVNLQRSETTDMLCHNEHYTNKAIKLLRLHNETIEALNRYRRGGEQKIIVQHNVRADKAVVNFPIEGADTKNRGDTPCSANYAAQKPEPIAINHAGNPPWSMDDADFTAAKVQVLNQKRVKCA